MKLYLFSLALLWSFNANALDAVPGEYIVRYKKQNPGMQALGKTSLQHNMSLKTSWSNMNLHHFKTRDDSDNAGQTLRDLREDPEVLFAEPNYYVQAADLSYFMTSAPIKAPESWIASTPSGPGVVTPVVAVLDSGLDVSHSVFDGTGRLWENSAELNGVNGIDDDGNGYIDDINGWNFIDNNHDLTDNSGHGTHVSGIAVGATEDISSISGSEMIKVMPLKFLDANGIGTTAAAINAIYYAVDNGAKVLNNSWGGSDYSVALHEAITYSYYQGTLFVAAAGNNSNNNDNNATFPASYDVPNVLAVGASTDGDTLASFSNYGAQSVDVLAPGVNIISSIPGGGFGVSSGTSMSSPFVAGLASLVVREAPQFSGFQIKETVLSSATVVAGGSGLVLTEARVAFENTVLAAQSNKSAPTFQPDYTPVYDYSSRELASSDSAAGCGRVKDIYKQQLKAQKEGGKPLIARFFVALLLMLPLFAAAFGRYANRHRAKRKYKRVKVDFIGDLCLSGMNIPVSIEDISPGGAGICLKNEKFGKFCDQAKDVTLKVYAKDKSPAYYPCTIVRNFKGRVGLKF